MTACGSCLCEAEATCLALANQDLSKDNAIIRKCAGWFDIARRVPE